MIETFSLKVDNSSLTGESVAVTLKPDTSDPNHLESKNLAFYSTSVTEGKGKVGVGGEAHTVPGRGGEDGRRHGDGRHRGAGQCLHRRHGSVTEPLSRWPPSTPARRPSTRRSASSSSWSGSPSFSPFLSPQPPDHCHRSLDRRHLLHHRHGHGLRVRLSPACDPSSPCSFSLFAAIIIVIGIIVANVPEVITAHSLIYRPLLRDSSSPSPSRSP